MHGHVGAAAHGDADVGGGQSRGVIDAIADHGDDAGFLQFGDGGGFVGWQYLGVHVFNAQGLGHHAGAATVVAGQQMTADAPCGQLLHRFQCAGFERVTEGEQPENTRLGALFNQPRQGAAFGFPGFGGFAQSPGV